MAYRKSTFPLQKLQLKRNMDVLLVCKMLRGSGTQGQKPLWSKAAFIARVWIGLDRSAISLPIVHLLAFKNSQQRITKELNGRQANSQSH